LALGIFVFSNILSKVYAGLTECPKVINECTGEIKTDATLSIKYCLIKNDKDNNLKICHITSPNEVDGADRKREENSKYSLALLEESENAYLFKDGDLIDTNSENKPIDEGYMCTSNGCKKINKSGAYIVKDNIIAIYSSSFSTTTKADNNDVYINGNGSDLTNGIIKCDSSACTVSSSCTSTDYEYYIDSNEYETNYKGVIVCSKKSNACESKKGATLEGYYLNYGLDSSTLPPLIKCDIDNTKKVTCTASESSGNNVFYVNPVDTSTMAYCSTTTSCEEFKSPSDGDYYYISGINPTNDNDNVIYCDNGKCRNDKISSSVTVGYYITYIPSVEKYGLIKYKKSDPTPFTLITPTNFSGYYLNTDPSTNNNYPLFKCTSEGCVALKLVTDISPGFYVNAEPEDESKPIIVCDENKCVESNDYLSTSSEKSKGSYTYDNKVLKLYVGEDITEDGYSQSTTETDDNNSLYYFIEISSLNVFPSVTSNIQTLFKVNRYSITRLIVDSNFSVETSSRKITNGGSIGSDVELYVCTSKTKLCVEKSICSANTYLLDNINDVAYYCNESNVLTSVTSPGYYVDNSRSNISTYVIKCSGNNKDFHCEYVSSPKNYYINAGYNKANAPLIYCDATNCVTLVADIGNYLSGEIINGSNGIIKCSSATSCSVISNVNSSDHYYINNGNDKISKALINCYNRVCTTISPSIGNYITDDSSNLIRCDSSINCYIFAASVGFYDYASHSNNGGARKKVIECELKTSIICEPKEANSGFYVSNTSNVLINCTGNGSKCSTIVAKNGIFRSATTRITSTSRRRDVDLIDHEERSSKIVYNIIVCSATSCNELSASELAAIPYCTFDNNKCFINNKLSTSTSSVSSIASGGYCTSSDREIFYFATDTIVPETDILYGSTSIYTYTTTNTNCIKVSNSYANNYFTVSNNIYHIDEGQITQIVNSGFYFINIHTNTLVTGNEIDNYNDEDVKLFKCNDNSCIVIDKPQTTTYIADVNKRIIKYNPNSDAYTFAYENDIICMYSNNKCTPRSDLKNQEFCITYRGELVLAGSSIKSRETGDCYKSHSINNAIFGYSSQFLYSLTTNFAQIIDETGYYIVSLSTNNTATYKDFTNRNNPVKIYGCVLSQCNEVEPEPGVYYYDPNSRHLFMYDNGEWISPTTSGYALISTNPNEVHIYKYILNTTNNKVTLKSRATEGYYYTADNEMYFCDENNDTCSKVDDSGYYFSNSGEMFYCLYDSEGLEKISCTKQSCLIGQFYYIDEKYYRCDSGSIFSLVSSKYCKYDENVIINFFTAYIEEFPSQVKTAIESIAINNNSTAIEPAMNKNYMNVVPGVFTNCTYNSEDKTSTFDLICINNFVSYNKGKDNYEICSAQQLGYVECIEDENNSNKCNVSGAISRYIIKFSSMIVLLFVSVIYLFI